MIGAPTLRYWRRVEYLVDQEYERSLQDNAQHLQPPLLSPELIWQLHQQKFGDGISQVVCWSEHIYFLYPSSRIHSNSMKVGVYTVSEADQFFDKDYSTYLFSHLYPNISIANIQ
ncbi:hypothetical protein AVEN_211482-1 [Araneus ventricosus]|uniref:Uncharacterized protein n=1 Tax=Araneus ventricosus TaxID=182803 RepID=A0A4Y2M6R1_ARAVE|nr:hypothetical protein AVEN_211482-1 [Araneus ventricosus]